jgi:hypothetical protein
LQRMLGTMRKVLDMLDRHTHDATATSATPRQRV